MKKKIIIIVIAIIAVLAVGIGILSQTLFVQSSNENDSDNVSFIDETNTNDNTDNLLFNSTGQYESTSENVMDNANTNGLSSLNDDGASNDSKYSEEEYVWNGQRLPNYEGDRVTSDSGADTNAFGNDDWEISKINAQQFENTAKDFLWNFTTYNADMLRTGQYLGSFSKYVDSGSVPSNSILKQHMNGQWISNSSSYKEMLSYPISIATHPVYISHGGDTDGSFAVRLDLEVIKNQDEPGIVDWAIMNRCKESWAVYFNADGIIVDAKMQSSKVIEFNVQ